MCSSLVQDLLASRWHVNFRGGEGVCYRLIDQKAITDTTSRALALHSRTLEIFSYMDIVKQIVARSRHITGVTVYDRERFLMVLKLLHTCDTPYPHILILPQNETEQTLYKHLMSLGGKVEYSRELVNFRQEEGALIAQITLVHDLTGDREEVRTRWLIGCDGSHSRVRHILGVPFAGHTLAEEFLLTDVDLDWEKSRETSYAWLHQDGLFAALPLPHRKQWRLFASVMRSVGQYAPLASVALFQKLFQERTGDMKTTISNPIWLSNFRISERLVMRYRQGSVFLAGDAAHIHSPFGGQGMNMGIQDAYNLAWKLALVIQRSAPERLLDTYEQERRPVASRVVRDTHTLTDILISQNMVWHFIRWQVIVRLFRFHWIQKFLSRRGSELDLTYCSSILTHRAFSWRRESRSGSRIQQAYFRLVSSGKEANLFSLLQEPTSILLLFTGTQPVKGYSYLVHIALLLKEHLGHVVRVYIVLKRGEKSAGSQWNEETLLDYQGDLYRLYGGKEETICFIRPDGYIGLCQKLDEKHLWAYLRGIFTFSVMTSESLCN